MDPLQDAFAEHPRRWRDFRYVYPVIARRSRGLSLGINLNPDAACTFNCVYCCVERTAARPPAVVDVAVVERELRALAADWRRLFSEPEFQDIPGPFRRLNDFAFSGDGEPTVCPVFPQAVQAAARVRRDLQLQSVRLVLITNACCLDRPPVVAGLAELDRSGGEIWAKLDAGTEAHFRRVNRAGVAFQRVLDNLLAAARVRPIVIQSMFLRLGGAGPAEDELEAYLGRLQTLLDGGGQIQSVQVYTVARRTAEAGAEPLPVEELEAIAARVRALGLAADVFP